MAIAQENIASTLTIAKTSPTLTTASVWEMVHRQIQRWLWHSHAYGTVLGVLLLTIASLIFLTIHWLYRLLFTHQAQETMEHQQ
ncbi:hypothetical protein B6N60_03933 [Richelia sinica FACHB-800]|uniref:Uncharacterized protein n=1 Tax=Richelia sinica FACHB-800 TaxID=1357546 RepID=A0A975TB49_9NOST|nr:hypothetical protein [Richelia sinica]MBD2664596.1 hypothetical protein [Richelia sinica FACHB-800]QXE25220.1 hypothetical protein B6N60_03933 [Richelia sinica FACHB-800]